jgi:hypothetical protein
MKQQPQQLRDLEQRFLEVDKMLEALESKQVETRMKADNLAHDMLYSPFLHVHNEAVLSQNINMAKENKYGFAEVVDTISDAIEFGDKVEKALKDGFQVTDLMILVAEFPRLKEIYQDRKTFLTEFKDLIAAESEQALAQISKRTGLSGGVVRTKSLAALDLAYEVQALVDDTITRAKRIVEKSRLLV